MLKLSIIIPIYFNEKNIPITYNKIQDFIISKNIFDYEIIFVDDDSNDNSLIELKKIANINKNVKIIKLSKNYGSHLAILAGLEQASGACITSFSADLQDPPKIIFDMFKKWQEGYKIVLAVRKNRHENFLQKSFSNFYYHLIKKIALTNMPEGGFDCFLIDKKVANILISMEEKNSTLMGQILWCGFKTSYVYYTRRARKIGKSKWTLAKKIKLFIDSFIAFSYFPIRAMSGIGFFIATLSFFYGVFVFINKIFFGVNVQGWTTLIILVSFLSGIQMIMLGIIGEYLWRSFDESRKRPPFIIEEKINF